MAADIPTTAAAGAGHATGGLPQFDLSWWPGEIAWTLLIFVVLYALFAKVFVPRVGGTIADREDRIAGDIGDARRLKEQADQQAASASAEMVAARSVAHRLALDAKSKAAADTAAQEALEDARLNEVLAKAETRIGAARDQAMTHVRGIAGDTAQAIVAHLTGREASADEVKSALAGRA